MRYRRLGKTGFKVSEVGFGAWAIGGDWGGTDDTEAMKALHAAADAGVTFYDTADVYGDGHSERLLARFAAERDEELIVATKCGRRGSNEPDDFTDEHLTAWIDRSRENLQTDRLDLVQLHCPPTALYYQPKVFAVLDELVAEGRMSAWGVSVERVEEGLKALEYPGCASIQIIFNAFRQRPKERLFAAAWEADVGIIARVPLASGLLTGKYDADATFPEDDHRNFNAQGQAFDVGETFAGVPLEVGAETAGLLRDRVPNGASMAQFAIRWILMHAEVSTVIAGARNTEQAADNAAASLVQALSDADMEAVELIYTERIAPYVHQRW
jgi:aryl-alcohol dehydrogenase-like predicted oxidoreductase